MVQIVTHIRTHTDVYVYISSQYKLEQDFVTLHEHF